MSRSNNDSILLPPHLRTVPDYQTTKATLIEALRDFPDDSPVVVLLGDTPVPIAGIGSALLSFEGSASFEAILIAPNMQGILPDELLNPSLDQDEPSESPLVPDPHTVV